MNDNYVTIKNIKTNNISSCVSVCSFICVYFNRKLFNICGAPFTAWIWLFVSINIQTYGYLLA
jgi:hypothetical protein